MKVKELIKLLKKEDPNADVVAWLGADEGWELVKIGIDDAIIGRMTEGFPNPEKCVLLPVQVPKTFNKWAEEEDLN